VSKHMSKYGNEKYWHGKIGSVILFGS
jgi:hypothetical protein